MGAVLMLRSSEKCGAVQTAARAFGLFLARLNEFCGNLLSTFLIVPKYVLHSRSLHTTYVHSLSRELERE